MGEKGKILVIDDDAAVCDLVFGMLQPKGYEVLTAGNAQEGVDKAAEVKPDLIFISLLLPDSNGLKASKAIHSLEGLRTVPIVMLISYQGELDPRYTVTIGIVDVLVKPLRKEDVLAKTAGILGKGMEEYEAEPIEAVHEVDTVDEELEAFLLDEVELGEKDEEKDAPRLSSPEKGSTPAERESEDLAEIFGVKEKATPVTEPEAFGHGSAEVEYGEEQRREADLDLEEEESEEAGKQKADALQDYPGDEVSGEEPQRSRKTPLVLGAVLLTGVAVAAVFYFLLGGRSGDLLSGGKGPDISEKRVISAEEGTKQVADNLPVGVAEQPKEGGAVAKEGDGQAEVTAKAVPEKKLVEGKTAETKPSTPASKPGVPEKEKGGKIFSVQLGYFGQEKNATALADRLSQKGYDVAVKKEEKSPEKVYFRLLVGSHDSRKSALEEARILKEKEGLDGVVYAH